MTHAASPANRLPIPDWMLPERSKFLPTQPEDLAARGIEQLDVVMISGDSYVDHPTFGVALVGRLLESLGLKVGVIAQPDLSSPHDLRRLGCPRLFFGITGGALDSMLSNYTAQKRKRTDDAYAPDGIPGRRPDRAVNTYAHRLRELFGRKVPIVAGGMEASMRRLAHYDYWSHRVRPSSVIESGADLIVYGMGERTIEEIARRLMAGQPIESCFDLPGTACKLRAIDVQPPQDLLVLPSFEEVAADKTTYAQAFRLHYRETLSYGARPIYQKHRDAWVKVNPPQLPLTTDELDRAYALPYVRLPHPDYKGARIPAWDTIKFSVQMHRGCFGGCSFCAIAAHQGKAISSRSEASILNEIRAMQGLPGFTGVVSDLGGPTANMYKMAPLDFELCRSCKRESCIWPRRCSNIQTDHRALTELYRDVRKLPMLRMARVSSGLRYDLCEEDREHGQEYLEELLAHHVGGRLKVAPEHSEPSVLKLMRKPSFEKFEAFDRMFREASEKVGKEQYLVPYFISSHPGCTEKDTASLGDHVKRMGYRLEQVQDFTPTPMTPATAMYWTGLDPFKMTPLYVERRFEGRRRQKDLLKHGSSALGWTAPANKAGPVRGRLPARGAGKAPPVKGRPPRRGKKS